jgi:hypothetical protein
VRELLVIDIQTHIGDFRELSISSLTHAELRRWAKWIATIESAAAGQCRSSVRTASPLRGWAGSSAEGPRERGAVAVPDVYSIPENVAGPLAAGKREMDEVAEEYLVDVDSQQRERQAVQRFCATPFCSMNCSVGSEY